MQIVPTSLVRISRYYMIAAIVYLLLTLGIGVARTVTTLPTPMLHWAPAVLGWVMFPIMGAFYQFFPTLQGRDLHWESLTIPQFVLVNIGVLGLIGAAWTANGDALVVSAVIYSAGALLFAAIIGLGNVDLSKINLTLRFYLASLVYFVAAIVLLLLSVLIGGPAWVTRPLVLHLLVFGSAIITIMGAEYSMVPMLQLKELRHPRLADAQFYVANLGFWGLAISMAIQNTALTVAAGVLSVGGILLFAYIIVASLRHGPSRLPHMDISVKYFLVGITYLIVTAVAGIALAADVRFLLPIHVHLGLIGVVTMTIVGAMYHVVPFVVWWEVYAPKLGYEDVPLLKQLYSERGAALQLYGLNLGLWFMIAGFALGTNLLLALGGTILIVTALAFAWAMLNVVQHRKNLQKPNTHHKSENFIGGIVL